MHNNLSSYTNLSIDGSFYRCCMVGLILVKCVYASRKTSEAKCGELTRKGFQ